MAVAVTRPGLTYRDRPASITGMLPEPAQIAEQTFIVHGERRVTFGCFLDAIPRAAAALARLGASPGDRVFLLSYNRPEVVLATWAAWWAGLVPVLGNRWWSDHEIEHAVALTRPTVTLSDRDAPASFTAARWTPISELAPILSGGDGALNDPCEAAPAISDDEEAPALILFTSGSSGAAKAVVLPQRSVVANQQNLLVRSRKVPSGELGRGSQDVVLAVTPLFHIGGLSSMVTQLITGGRLVLTEGRFDAGAVLELIERERVTRWGGVPTMAARVLAHPDFDHRDLSSLRSFPLGGAPVTADLLRRMRDKLPQLEHRGLANTWGMTESGGFVTVAGNRDLERYPGTVGRPYPVAELRIAQPEADAGHGEILLRSPTVMLGYLGPDDGTVDDDGWLHTGDLGWLNEEGYLFLAGRSKDIVIRGGENIACAHVEQALLSHPDVVEAAVFGLPHPDLGEELAAAVTVREGSGQGPDGLRDYLRARLAHFEVPTRWQVSGDPLPTLPGEKIDKRALRARLAQ